MPGDERSPGKDVINIAVAIRVIEIGPFTVIDEKRLSTDGTKGAHRGIYAAGK